MKCFRLSIVMLRLLKLTAIKSYHFLALLHYLRIFILTFIISVFEMNSGELKVDVPLASVESDCEEIADSSLVNTPQHGNVNDNKLKANGGPGGRKAPSPRLNYEGGYLIGPFLLN